MWNYRHLRRSTWSKVDFFCSYENLWFPRSKLVKKNSAFKASNRTIMIQLFYCTCEFYILTVNTCEFKSPFCWPVWRVVCTGHCKRFGLWINYFRHRVMATFAREALSFPLCRTKRPAWLKLILVSAEWSLRSTYRHCYPSLSGTGCYARRIAW